MPVSWISLDTPTLYIQMESEIIIQGEAWDLLGFAPMKAFAIGSARWVLPIRLYEFDSFTISLGHAFCSQCFHWLDIELCPKACLVQATRYLVCVFVHICNDQSVAIGHKWSVVVAGYVLLLSDSRNQVFEFCSRIELGISHVGMSATFIRCANSSERAK